MDIELTQEELNTLGFNYKCCFATKGEELANDIKRGKDCKCKQRKLVFLKELIDAVNCFSFDKTVEHKPEKPAKFFFRLDTVLVGSDFNAVIPANALPSISIGGISLFDGNHDASPSINTGSSTLLTWFFNTIIDNILNDYTTLYPLLTFNSIMVEGPLGDSLAWNSTTPVNVNGTDFTVNGSVQTLFSIVVTSGLNSITLNFKLGTGMIEAIAAITKEYTTEELNCLTEDELQNIIEYINKECDCCI